MADKKQNAPEAQAKTEVNRLATETPQAQQVALEVEGATTLPQLEQRILEHLSALSTRISTIETAPIATSPVAEALTPTRGSCGCSEKRVACCCFDIYISRVRIIERQQEVNDGLVLKRTNLELIFHATADGFSGVYPSLNSHIQISQLSGWTSANKKITQVKVSGSKRIPVMAEAREVEQDGTGLRPEHGSSGEYTMMLSCGCDVVPMQLSIPLTGGGQGGGVVEIEISAKEVCCDVC